MPPQPTRLEATLACHSAGLQLHFAWAGLELTDGRLGVAVIPTAQGRLNLRVIGYPSLTGDTDARNLLGPEARHDFAPEDVRLEGGLLVCLVPHERADALRQGFTLALEPAMAQFLSAWLPRLARVATLTAPVVQRVAALLAPAPSAQGLGVCAELVATVLLDRKSVDAALAAVAHDHWAGRDPVWQAAFAEGSVRQLLEAIALEARGGRTSVAGQAASEQQQPAV